MHFTTTLLTLATLATLTPATNIAVYTGRDCRGAARVYTNIGPRVCANAIQGNTGSPSAGFTSVPGGSEVYGWQGSRTSANCGALKSRAKPRTGTFCLTIAAGTGTFAGASWSRVGAAKRAVEGAEDVEPCVETRLEPDLVRLEDGSEYEIAKMDGGELEALSEFAVNGTRGEDLPEEYKLFQTN